jgi:hypothetical protein
MQRSSLCLPLARLAFVRGSCGSELLAQSQGRRTSACLGKYLRWPAGSQRPSRTLVRSKDGQRGRRAGPTVQGWVAAQAGTAHWQACASVTSRRKAGDRIVRRLVAVIIVDEADPHSACRTRKSTARRLVGVLQVLQVL